MTRLSVSDMKARSGLPGPRGNLSLFYEYLENVTPQLVGDCLAELTETTANSPEEFVGMCGVAGFALLHAPEEAVLREHLVRYAAHPSWRIREAVAMAIQESPSLTWKRGWRSPRRWKPPIPSSTGPSWPDSVNRETFEVRRKWREWSTS